MGMAGPTLPAAGTADWIDATHNWRQSDAEWLQARSVIRGTEAGASGYTPSHVATGSVLYDTGVNKVKVKTGANWENVFSSSTLTFTSDSFSGGSVGFTGGINVSGSTTIASPSLTGTTAAANLTLSGTLTATSAALTTPVVKNAGGANSVILSASATDTLSVPNINVTSGASVSGTSTLTTVNVSGTLTVAGSGGVYSSGTGDIRTSSGNIYTATGYVGSTTSGARLTGTKLQHGPNNKYLDIDTGFFKDAASTEAHIACVVFSATDPGLVNYPNGTIWIQT